MLEKAKEGAKKVIQDVKDKQPWKNKKFVIIAIVVLVIIIVGIILLITLGGNKNKMAEMNGVLGQSANYAMVKTEHPQKGDVSVQSFLTGDVESSGAVYIYSEASGDVTAVNVKVGDKVKSGDILCEINTGLVESAKNSMESAQISMDQAKSNLERMKILHAGGDITEQEWEQYQNNAKTAELQYNTAKSNYEKQLRGSSVSTPINGTVQSCSVEVNDKVSGNQVIFVIVGNGNKRISFYVSERIMKHLAEGDEMNVIKNGTTYPGKISSVNTIVDDQTGLFECTAELDTADEIAIGSIVKIEITSDHVEDALTVPVDAIYYSGGDAYIYTVEDGKAKMTPVVVGLYDDETAEIIEGVTEEDEIISTWSNNLYEGANVRIAGEEYEEGMTGMDNNAQLDNSQNQGGGLFGGGMPSGGGGMPGGGGGMPGGGM